MKIVNVVKNYLPKEKCNELNNWVIEAISSNKLGLGLTTEGEKILEHGFAQTPNRFNSRLGDKNYEYPQLVRDIREQLQSEFNLTKWKNPIHPHGKNGVVVTAIKNNGDVYPHHDSSCDMRPKELLRCNILTSETEGALIWVGDESYQLKKGDMMQYLVSKHQHSVEKIIAKDNEYRIMWMFGWFVDPDEWEKSIQ